MPSGAVEAPVAGCAGNGFPPRRKNRRRCGTRPQSGAFAPAFGAHTVLAVRPAAGLPADSSFAPAPRPECAGGHPAAPCRDRRGLLAKKRSPAGRRPGFACAPRELRWSRLSAWSATSAANCRLLTARPRGARLATAGPRSVMRSARPARRTHEAVERPRESPSLASPRGRQGAGRSGFAAIRARGRSEGRIRGKSGPQARTARTVRAPKAGADAPD